MAEMAITGFADITEARQGKRAGDVVKAVFLPGRGTS